MKSQDSSFYTREGKQLRLRWKKDWRNNAVNLAYSHKVRKVRRKGEAMRAHLAAMIDAPHQFNGGVAEGNTAKTFSSNNDREKERKHNLSIG